MTKAISKSARVLRAAATIFAATLAWTGSAAAQQSPGAGEETFPSPWERQQKKSDGTKITGGQQVEDLKYWPGFAALRFRGNGDNVVYFCGGVMIAEQWMLTAAHCLKQWDCEKGPKGVCAPTTSLDLSRWPDYARHKLSGIGKVEVVTGLLDLKTKPLPDQVHKAVSGHRFPDYVVGVQKQVAGTCEDKICAALVGHDIALVRISGIYKGPVARLSSSKDEDPPDRDGIRWPVGVVGFGRTEDDGKLQGERVGSSTVVALSMRMMWTLVPTVSTRKCQDQYEDRGYSIFPHQICASDEKTADRDTCQGDSGGPLMAFDNFNRPYVIGLTSWGIGCANEGNSGVYTRVSMPEFRTWMKSLGVTPRSLSARERVSHEAGDRARAALARLRKTDQLDLKICTSGMSLGCAKVGNRLPAVDRFLAMKLRATRASGGNVVVFLTTPAGRIEQLFPRGTGTLESSRLAAKQDMVVPRSGAAVTGFPFDWDIEDGVLTAVLLPAVGNAKVKAAEDAIRSAGLAAEPAKGQPADGERYIKALTDAVEATRGESAVAMITRLER